MSSDGQVGESAAEVPDVTMDDLASPPAQRLYAFRGHPAVAVPEALKIDRMAHPDWQTGAERIPTVGEEVFCTEGTASVSRVLGKTGNGSRLLELRLEGTEHRTFFAAASNVLVAPQPQA